MGGERPLPAPAKEKTPRPLNREPRGLLDFDILIRGLGKLVFAFRPAEIIGISFVFITIPRFFLINVCAADEIGSHRSHLPPPWHPSGWEGNQAFPSACSGLGKRCLSDLSSW